MLAGMILENAVPGQHNVLGRAPRDSEKAESTLTFIRNADDSLVDLGCDFALRMS